MTAYLRNFMLGLLLCSLAVAQTVDPAYQDGVLFLRVAVSTPQVVLPVGHEPSALLQGLAAQPELKQVLEKYGLVHIRKLGETKASWLQRTYVVHIEQKENIKECIAALFEPPIIVSSCQQDEEEERYFLHTFVSYKNEAKLQLLPCCQNRPAAMPAV